jgi:hypothetical protein
VDAERQLVIAMDPAKLREMRRYADELRNEIAEREARLEGDPLAAHDALMASFRADPPEVTRSAPQVIHKVTDNGSAHGGSRSPHENAGQASPLDNDTLIDGIAGAMAQMRQLMMAEYEARIAMLEGQVTTLLTMLGSADASRAKANRKRHADVGLLEDRRSNP